MEERYIQLPPLPADMEVQALELLWQFAILGEEEQKEALEYIKEDEYVEVTPNHLRLRKIILDEIERKRANKV